MEKAQDIGKLKRNFGDQGLAEDGGQRGEHRVSTSGAAWDDAIGKDKSGTDGVDVRLDLGLNALIVELILVKTAGMGQLRRVEGCESWEEVVHTHDVSKFRYVPLRRSCSYCNVVNAGGVGLALVGRAALLVGMVQNVKVMMSSTISGKISSKAEDFLSNEKDIEYSDGPVTEQQDVS